MMTSLICLLLLGTCLQKNKKYGAVVNIITSDMISSFSVWQENRNTGIINVKMHENKNITLEGAVIYKN